MKARPFFIGIAGGSGAGKTFLAGRLAGKLDGHSAAVIPLDAYYRDLSDVPVAERERHNFDEPAALEHELLESHLEAAAAGNTASLPVYDFKTHTRAFQRTPFVPGRYVILEGLFALYWESVRRRLDFKIYLDTDRDLCHARRKERDVRERGRSTDDVVRCIQERVRPMFERYVAPTRQYADLVIDGDLGEDGLEAIGRQIRSLEAREGHGPHS